MGEAQALQNRMYIYYTKRPMLKLIEWGAIELNPTMWLTIWSECILNYISTKKTSLRLHRNTYI